MEEDERRPKTTASVEIIRSQIKAGSPALYAAYKLLSGMGSIVSPILLSIAGYLYNTVHSEWVEMKTEVAIIRRELDKMPTPEESDKLREQILAADPLVREKLEDLSDRVRDLNERTVLVESVCCDYAPIKRQSHRK